MATQQNYLVTEAHRLVYQRLVEIARKNGPPIGYGEIFDIMGLERGNHAANQAGRLLDDINQHAHLLGKPMLSALVVNQQTHMPGGGFYGLAVRFGKLPANSTDQQKAEFWKKELARVYTADW